MMMQDQLRAIACELDPLVITAPTIRSGTTLLQRLLCSSSKALIYGEPCAQDLEFFLHLYTCKAQQYDCRREEVSTSLRKVLSGEVNDWIPTLMPDVKEYLKALGQGAFSGISYCRDYAIQAGRPFWGFKHPGWNPVTVRLMRTLMPRSRFIFIHRDLKDCLKSAKTHGSSYGATYSKDDIREFCRSWAENSNYMLTLSGESTVLSLRFQDLVTDPQPTLTKLAEFTGIDDMDPMVLDRKINTWVGEANPIPSSDGYFRPAELDEYDWQMINATNTSVVEGSAVC
jgi:Sulfotransferase family